MNMFESHDLVEANSDIDDRTLLELILRPGLGAAAGEVADDLLTSFGTFSQVLAAPEARLRRISATAPIPLEIASTLAATRLAAERLAKARINPNEPVLADWGSLMDYLHIKLGFEPVEHLRVLYLDDAKRLIADEAHQRGTVNHTPLYPREIIKRALELGATALVMVHNHPCGALNPSVADLTSTRTVMQIGHPLGITVFDHVIVSKAGHASLRALKLI